MRGTLTFTESAWERISSTLFDDATEHIAFARAGVGRSPGRIDFLVQDVLVPDDAELDAQSPAGIRLSPDGVCRVMTWGREARALVDMHNHVWRDPSFSGTDDAGARVQWRLLQDLNRGALLLQIVFGPDGSFQARWRDTSAFPRWRRLRHIQIVGPNGVRRVRPWDARRPMTRAPSAWAASAHERTKAIIARSTLDAIEELRVGIVGVGGNGSAVRALAPFFFRKVTLCDGDTVEASNLGRLFGATPDDAAAGASKVEVGRRETLRMRPDASVVVVPAHFPDPAAVAALKDCELIVACPDNDATRYALAEFAARHMKVLVELGTGVVVEEGRVVTMGSQVRFQWPGGPCLACLNVAPAALEAPATTESKVRIGYIRGTTLTPAEVVTTNATAAALAMRNLLAFVTGHLARPVPTYLYYDETVPVLVDASRAFPRRPDCPVCGTTDGAVACWGDELPPRLRVPDAPKVEPLEVMHAHD